MTGNRHRVVAALLLGEPLRAAPQSGSPAISPRGLIS